MAHAPRQTWKEKRDRWHWKNRRWVVAIPLGGAGVDGSLSMATIAIEVVIGAWEVGGILSSV